jgi:hypothetical protein
VDACPSAPVRGYFGFCHRQVVEFCIKLLGFRLTAGRPPHLIVSMNTILVCVEIPKRADNPDADTFWFHVLDGVNKMKWKNQRILKPVENVWQFPLDSGLTALAELIQFLKERQAKYKVLLLEKEPIFCG